MNRRQRLVFLALALLVLVVVARVTLDSFDFVFRDFWFSAGLLLLLLLSVVDQPHFSKDSSVFLNGVAGLVALLTVLPNARTQPWHFFFIWVWYLVISSYFLMIKRSQPLSQEPRFVQLTSRINRTIGRPEALFSAFFLWGIYTQFAPNSEAFVALMWFWAVFIVLDLPAVSQALGEWLTPTPTTVSGTSGALTGFVSPRIIEAELGPTLPKDLLGHSMEVRVGSEAPCAIATVIDDIILAGRRRARLGITETTERWHSLSDGDASKVTVTLLANSPSPSSIPVSAVDQGTAIGELRIRVNPATDLQDGDLLWTELPTGEKAYYQIVGAAITQDNVGGEHAVHEVTISASQLGLWNEKPATFEPLTWVPPAGGLVFKGSSAPGAIPDGHLRIGQVPASEFPVHVDLDDIVTHNTAVLGVTGSGKSYLTLSLVEGLIAAGVRTLVLDISRQYWSILQTSSPVAIRQQADIQAWLSGSDKLAVYQFADSTNYTRTTALYVEECFRFLQGAVALRPGMNEPARLCVVMEEAHSLIPEWNQVAERDDPANVNRTARTVLQGRKYGMGIIVVSQRTANVTKTILNQCNTVFAFQCFDKTGLEFLRNYMGDYHSESISTLPNRQAILVGKASSSQRPIRMVIDDFANRWIQPEEPEGEAV